ncbi:MAG: hypothetical protein QNJ73_05490 [Gammaproteobacteria bacterium]|nr:hypothetical protein [Gammaproteobacteria bacterium]
MYPHHFSLTSRPFTSGPGSYFFVANEGVSQAVSQLQDVLLSRDAVAVISGGPGVGKTALLEHARSGCGDTAVIAWADLRQVDPEELFDTLILSLGGEAVDGCGPGSWRRLINMIKEHNDAGRMVTAAIDLSGITAERAKRLLRLVHMASGPHSQLNIVLMGPHTLHKLLDVPGLIHIRQRVSCRYRVRPLSDSETATYLAERIGAADGNPGSLLDSEVPKLVYRYVAGVPRLINTLMEAALTASAIGERDKVTPEMIQQVAHNLGWKTMGGKPRTAQRPAAAAKPQQPAAAAAAPAAAAAASSGDGAKHDATAALLASDFKLETEKSDEESGKPADEELTDKLKKMGPAPAVDEASGLPEMSADDTSATGMLRLEDLDERFAESVFGGE